MIRKHKKGASSRNGFTLLEILLVIALVGLLSGFLLTDWGNLGDAFGRRNWRESLQEAFRQGHFLAETRNAPVRMRFDGETKEFVLESAAEGEVFQRIGAAGINAVRVSGEGRGVETGIGRNGFSIVFGVDGSAAPIEFEVERPEERVLFRNHPFSGRLFDGSENFEDLAYSNW